MSGSTVIIKAINKDGYPVNAVSKSGSATLSQTVSGMVRTITLSDISSNVTVTFDGFYHPLQWPADGVYVVQSDGTPVDPIFATTNCIGAALSDNTTGQKLMIEKYEASNSSYATAASGKTSTSIFYWGGYGTDQSISNITSTTVAEADYNGKSQSEVLKSVTTGGSGYTSYATIGAVLNQYISNVTDNQGYTDWYIPASGQLYLISLNMANINTALSAIGGTQLSDAYYWSSSEHNSSNGWFVYLPNGTVSDFIKNYYCRVRFVRDLS